MYIGGKGHDLLHYKKLNHFDVQFLPECKYVQENMIYDIVNSIYHDQPTLIHCKQGRGRAGIVGICYYIQRYNMSWIEAYYNIKNKRNAIYLTREQWKCIKDYYNVNKRSI